MHIKVCICMYDQSCLLEEGYGLATVTDISYYESTIAMIFDIICGQQNGSREFMLSQLTSESILLVFSWIF